jgi:hypothetical protein
MSTDWSAIANDISNHSNKVKYRTNYTASYNAPIPNLKPTVVPVAPVIKAKPLNMMPVGTIGKYGQVAKAAPILASEKTVGVGKTGAVKIKPRKAGAAEALITGALDSATLGILNAGLNKVTKNTSGLEIQGHDTATQIGHLLGYVLPYSKAAKVIEPLVKGIKNPLVKMAIKGALINSAPQAVEDVAKGKDIKTIGKDALINASVGAAADLALHGAGKLVSNKIAKAKAIREAIPAPEPTPAPVITPEARTILNPKGKLGIIRPAVETPPLVEPIKAPIAPPVEPIIPEVVKPVGNKKIDAKILNPKGELKPQIVKLNTDTLPMEQRDFKNVGAKAVKSYQYDHPELKPFIKDEATILKGELERTLKASRGSNTFSNGEGAGHTTIGFGNQRVTSDSMAAIKDMTGASYAKISTAIDDIIGDKGKENNALSKRIELFIDDRLSNGYVDDMLGQDIPANPSYIEDKKFIDSLPDSINRSTFKKPLTPSTPTIYPTAKVPESVVAEKPVIPKVEAPVKVTETKALKQNTFKKSAQEYPSLGATNRTQSMQSIISSKNLEKTTAKQKFEAAYKHFVDVNAPVKKLGSEAYIKTTNLKRVGSTVDTILQKNLVDMNGKPIGEGLQNIVKDFPHGKETNFLGYLLQKHNVDRALQGSDVYKDFSSEESKKALQFLDKANPEFKALGDRLTKFINKLETEWGNKAGLISDDLWNQLNVMYKNYVPTQRGFSRIEKASLMNGSAGKGVFNTGNALKRATGSERDIINPIENIMNLVNKTVRAARRNEVGQTVLKAIEDNPKLSKFAEVVPATEKLNPNVNNVVTVLVKGEPVHIRFTQEGQPILESLQAINKYADVLPAEILRKFNTGFKGLITTYNPVFALRNILRDFPVSYIQGQGWNPVKHLYNVVKAGIELAKGTPLSEQYKALGGEYANFFNPQKVYRGAEELLGRKLILEKGGNIIIGTKKFSKMQLGIRNMGKAIERFNNLSESAPRFAEFKKTLARTGDFQKALFDAGEVTTNFARGGNVTKVLDAYVPYLNASVQGVDKFARAFDPRNPTKALATLIKGGMAVTVPTALSHYLSKDNPNYKELDTRTKDTYLLFPNVFGEKDAQGNAKTFIKIPKSREYGVIFSTLAERAFSAVRGDKNPFKSFAGTAFTNFLPVNPLTNNLASPLIYNLPMNKDFAGRPIVPATMTNDQRSAYLQYDEKNTELSKWLANEFHKVGFDSLSPKKIDYLARSYLGVAAQMLQPVNMKNAFAGTNEGNPLQNIAAKLLKPISTQFVADPTYSNKSVSDFFDNKARLAKVAADYNITNEIPSEDLTQAEEESKIFTGAMKKMTDLTKQINTANANNDQATVKDLKQQYIDIAKEANNTISENGDISLPAKLLKPKAMTKAQKIKAGVAIK